MNSKVRERRRSVNLQRGRKRGSLILLVVAVLVVVGLFLWLRSSDVFAVRRVLAPALVHVSSEQVREAASGARGVSLLKVSTHDVEKKLTALPYVRSAKVYRHFPDALEVTVQEYQPLARVQATDGHLWLVADDGKILAPGDGSGASEAGSLVLIVPATSFTAKAGSRLPDLIAGALPVAKLMEQADFSKTFPHVAKIMVSDDGRTVVILDSGAELRLGDPVELKDKLTVAAQIIEQYLRDGKQLLYADVSVPSRAVAKAR
jgi:cell division septal protein FtsQ